MSFQTFKGLSELKLYSIDEELIYNLPTPSDFVINLNYEERKIGSKNIEGESITGDSFVYARDPFIRVSFPVINPETLSLNLDRKFNTITDFKYSIVKTLDLEDYLDNSTINLDIPVLLNLDKNKIIKVKASTTRNTFSIPICINEEEGIFDLLKGYYEDGILSLTSSDYLECPIISLEIEYRDTVLSLGESLNKLFKLFITMVTDKDTISVITADKVKPRLDTNNLDNLEVNKSLIHCYFNLLTPAQRSDFYTI